MQLMASVDGVRGDGQPQHHRQGSRLAKNMKATCSNPMLIATCIALSIAMVEDLRSWFVGSVVFEAMKVNGQATPPIMVANLGATMALSTAMGSGGGGHDGASGAAADRRTDEQRRRAPQFLPRRVVLGVVVGRLIVVPMATLLLVAVLVQMSVIPATDRLLILFCLMQGATPSAMFLGIMCQM